MNVLLYGRFGEYPKEAETLVKNAGFTIVKNNPEVVLAVGGDGTILGAERDYPGVPKLPLRDSKYCHRCFNLSNEEVLRMLSEGKLKLKEFAKLETEVNGEQFTALGDITLRNQKLNSALRFSVSAGDKKTDELIGDGIVAATPYGATGYFYSITRQTFETGLGIAFNNIHNAAHSPWMLPESTEITVNILRGPGDLAADNNPKILTLTDGDIVTIRKSPQPARFYFP